MTQFSPLQYYFQTLENRINDQIQMDVKEKSCIKHTFCKSGKKEGMNVENKMRNVIKLYSHVLRCLLV